MINVYGQYWLNGEHRLCRLMENTRNWAEQFPNAYLNLDQKGANLADLLVRAPAMIGHLFRLPDHLIRDGFGVGHEAVNPNSMLPYSRRGIETVGKGGIGNIVSGTWDALGNLVPDALDTVGGVRHTP
jgi:hypothetical protein